MDQNLFLQNYSICIFCVEFLKEYILFNDDFSKNVSQTVDAYRGNEAKLQKEYISFRGKWVFLNFVISQTNKKS